MPTYKNTKMTLNKQELRDEIKKFIDILREQQNEYVNHQ